MSQDSSMHTFMMVAPCLDEASIVDLIKKAEADKISGELLDTINYLDPSTFPTQKEIEDALRQIEKIYGT